MSASVPHLAELPTESLEHVLLHLPGQDIIKMESVNRRFQNLIRNSPTLQHQRELFTAGLIDNPCNPCDLAQGRKLCEDYVHKWSKAATVIKDTRQFLPDKSSRWNYARNIGKSVLASYPTGDHGLGFLTIPQVTSREPIDIWSIPPFPFELFGLAVYHPENLLAVAERDGSLLRIHLLNLRDGSPYCAPPFDTLTWDIPWDGPPMIAGRFGITGSRIVAYLSHANYGSTIVTVLAWDRKTGDLILDLPTMDLMGSGAAGVIFLDEFRLMLTTRDSGTGSLQFIVFNTLIPQDRPMSSRRLDLPPQYDSDRSALIYVDQDRSLGKLNRDGPVITDPTQAILVVKLTKLYHGDVLLVVRIQPLIERVCSTGTGANIPWDEWGRDAVIMENPVLRYGLDVHVHGTHLVLLEMPYQFVQRGCPRIRTFDFGRRGRSVLPLLDKSGGAERKALFSDGGEFVLEATGVGVTTPWGGTGSHRNGSFFQVSLSDGRGSDVTLNIWELT